MPTTSALGGPVREDKIYSRGEYLVRIGAVATVYFVAARLGLPFAFLHGNATPVWPPTGIALAAVLLAGPRMWPGVAIGAFLANASIGTPLLASLAIAAGNGAEALIAAAVLRRARMHLALDRVRDVFSLLAVALAVPTVSASIGVSSLAASDALPATRAGYAWLVWWLGDAMGALVVGSVILVWLTGPTGWSRRRLAETAAMTLALAVVGIVVFGREPGPMRDLYPFAVFPFTMWASLRSGRHGATVASVVLSGIAVWGTALGLGPFTGAGSDVANLVLLEGFLASVAFTSLVITAFTSERARDHAVLALQAAALRNDIRERERVTSRLEASEAELRAVLDAIPDLMFRIAADGTFVDYHATRYDELISPPENFLGRTIDEVLPADLASELSSRMSIALETGEVVGLEYRLNLPIGPTDWEARISRNGPNEVVVIARNITARKDAERGLEESVQVLREADEERRRSFVRLVTTHEEVRAGFAGAVRDDVIRLLVDISLRLDVVMRRFGDPEVPADIRGLLSASELSIGRLQELTDRLHPSALDRAGLAAAVGDYLRAVAAEAGFSYHVDDRLVEEPSPEIRTVCYRTAEGVLAHLRERGRATRIHTVLERWLGGIRISISADDLGSQAEAPLGPGSRRPELAATHELAEALGGWCRVEGTPGHDTTIEIWIPDPSVEWEPASD